MQATIKDSRISSDGFLGGLKDIAFSFKAYWKPPITSGLEEVNDAEDARTILFGGLAKLVPSSLRNDLIISLIKAGSGTAEVRRREYSSNSRESAA